MTSPTLHTKAGSGTSPVAFLLRLFSSIRFGIILLAILFVYSSVGSAGIGIPWLTPFYSIRTLPGLEMTEFEWFHWWPFDLLIALICANLIVATLRRIKFKPVNYGVWMIHAGIIILCIGSVIYFSMKIEGDAPVIRRRVVITLPTGETVKLTAIPGNQTLVGSGDKMYAARISNIDPAWEILSGDDKGKKVYAVSVMMQPQDGSSPFIRQLLAGFPQYTEDTIRTDDPKQPFARAIKTIGKPLVDDTIQMSLEYEPQQYLYIAANITREFSLYLRPVGSKDWVERRIDDLPMFNDYVSSVSEVWLDPNDRVYLRSLNIPVESTDANDPLAGTEARITSYLKYATLEQRKLPGGDELDPVVSVRVRAADNRAKPYTLAALDPASNSAENGLLRFRWIRTAEELTELARVAQPALIWTDPNTGEERTLEITELSSRNPDAEFKSIEGTDYTYRVESVQDNLQMPSGMVVSLATIEVRTPERSFKRWVFTDPTMTRDMPIASADPHGSMASHDTELPIDPNLTLRYQQGKMPPPVTIIAGPNETDLGMLLALQGSEPRYQPLIVGQIADLSEGITLEVLNYAARTRTETRPFIVPRERRNDDNGLNFAMVKVELPSVGGTNSYWVPYHHWPFRDANDAMRRFPYRPTVVEGPNGKKFEMILSRHRLPLPGPVALDDFVLTTHTGGFTGSNLSIRDWTSVLTFDDDGTWSDKKSVSINAPIEHAGLWYFQAQWDPPMGPRFQGDANSAGLNYTVLGVGSRHGVNIQLAGCCIAVLGMIYAFYIKPFIRRRDREKALAAARQRAAHADSDSAHARQPQELVPVSASQVTESPS